LVNGTEYLERIQIYTKIKIITKSHMMSYKPSDNEHNFVAQECSNYIQE